MVIDLRASLGLELVSCVLNGTEVFDGMHGILEHDHLLLIREAALARDHIFVESDLVLPIDKEGVVGAFPLAISETNRGDIGQERLRTEGCFGGAESMLAQLLVDSLGIGVSGVFTNNVLSNISLHTLLKDSIHVLLLLFEQQSSRCGSIRVMVLVQDFFHILGTSLGDGGSPPRVPVLVVAKRGEEIGVAFDATTKLGHGITRGGQGSRSGS